MTLLLWLCLFTISATNEMLHDDHWMYQPITSDRTVKRNGTLILNCTVEDNDEALIQWSNPLMQTLYFSDKKALRDNRIKLVRSSAKELTISISNVTLEDEGGYSCTLMTLPVRTAKAMVTVLGVPTIPTITGYTGPVQEGGTIRLQCETSDSRPPAKLLWFKGDEELNGSKTSVTMELKGKTFTVTSYIELTVYKEDNEYAVVCVVEHESIGPRDRVAEQVIEVLYAPSARIVPSTEIPEEGKQLILSCEVDGNPRPDHFQWEKDNGDLNYDTLLVEENQLIFESLNKTEAGTYVCKVNNLLGSSKAIFILKFFDEPQAASHATRLQYGSLFSHVWTDLIWVLPGSVAALYSRFLFP